MNLDLSFYFECLKKGKNKIPDEFDTCLICHNEYVDNSILAIPNCCNKKVSFHKECIKTWLKNNETCPNCRYIYKYDRLYTIHIRRCRVDSSDAFHSLTPEEIHQLENIDTIPDIYMRIVDDIAHRTRIAQRILYMSFSANPEQHQPSDIADFSREGQRSYSTRSYDYASEVEQIHTDSSGDFNSMVRFELPAIGDLIL